MEYFLQFAEEFMNKVSAYLLLIYATLKELARTMLGNPNFCCNWQFLLEGNNNNVAYSHGVIVCSERT